MKWAEEKALQEQKLTLVAKKKDFISRKNISRICWDILLNSVIYQLKKLLMAN